MQSITTHVKCAWQRTVLPLLYCSVPSLASPLFVSYLFWIFLTASVLSMILNTALDILSSVIVLPAAQFLHPSLFAAQVLHQSFAVTA
jgi:hypothetical protein